MKRIFLILVPALMALISCNHKTANGIYVERNGIAVGYGKNSARGVSENSDPRMVSFKPEGIMPKATAFRMNGDYADNVAVTVDAAGNLVYFPAVSDISSHSKPISLGDGWWLNNQGIGENSVFTTYTFEDYANLGETPSPLEIKEAIIPGSGVVQMIQLPYSPSEARDNIVEVQKFLKGK